MQASVWPAEKPGNSGRVIVGSQVHPRRPPAADLPTQLRRHIPRYGVEKLMKGLAPQCVLVVLVGGVRGWQARAEVTTVGVAGGVDCGGGDACDA
jgi:hypothetical protein